jgi:hypothetical protein
MILLAIHSVFHVTCGTINVHFAAQRFTGTVTQEILWILICGIIQLVFMLAVLSPKCFMLNQVSLFAHCVYGMVLWSKGDTVHSIFTVSLWLAFSFEVVYVAIERVVKKVDKNKVKTNVTPFTSIIF